MHIKHLISRTFFRILIPLFTLLLHPLSIALANPVEKLTVGMELAYPPFEMADKSGNPCGISVDLANALASALNKKLEILNLPFDGLIPSLKTGKIDLIISSMTATPERAKSISFSNPYLETGLCLLVKNNSAISNALDLNTPSITIAVKQGTTGHLFASKSLPSAKLLVLDRESACVMEVIQGKANAFIYDQMSILKHWQQNRETTRALLNPFQKESWAIGVKKENYRLLEEVNAFLLQFQKEGGFDSLSEKWLPEQKALFKELGVPFVF